MGHYIGGYKFTMSKKDPIAKKSNLWYCFFVRVKKIISLTHPFSVQWLRTV